MGVEGNAILLCSGSVEAGELVRQNAQDASARAHGNQERKIRMLVSVALGYKFR